MVTTMEESAYESGTTRDVLERWLRTASDDDGSESILGRRIRGAEMLEFTGGRLTAVGASRANVILSGSFNPLHDGHRELLAAAIAMKPLGAVGAYEIGVTNADKGTLAVDEIARRL